MANIEGAGLVHSYMVNESRNEDEAFSTKENFWDAKGNTWCRAGSGGNGIQSRAKQQQDSFKAVLKAFQQTHRDAEILGFDLNSLHSWQDVTNVIIAAVEEDDARSRKKSFKGIASFIGRSMSNAAPSIVNVLENSLPNGEWTSIACGAIILIFKAFQVAAEIRTLVLDTLGNSVPLLETIERLITLYPSEARLRDAASELQIAVLWAIEGMLKWLREHPFRRMRALPLQAQYGSDLKARAQKVRELSNKLKDQADMVHKEQTDTILAKVIESNTILDRILEDNQDLLLSVVDTQTDISDVQAKLAVMDEELVQHHQRDNVWKAQADQHLTDLRVHTNGAVDWQRRHSNQMNQHQTELRREINDLKATVLNDFALLLMQSPQMYRLAPTGTASYGQPVDSPPNITVEATKQLLGDWTQVVADRQSHYFRVATDASPRVASGILMSGQLREWLTSPASQILFVTHELLDERVQPGSFVSASIHYTLATVKHAVCLTVFSTIAPISAPEDHLGNLLACLIAGLLKSVQFDDHTFRGWSDSRTTQAHEHSLRDRNVQYLGGLLKYLVTHVTSGSIYCVIDDFKTYERDCGQLTAMVFHQLEQLVETCVGRAEVVFKLLIVTPAVGSQIMRYANGAVAAILEAQSNGDVRGVRLNMHPSPSMALLYSGDLVKASVY